MLSLILSEECRLDADDQTYSKGWAGQGTASLRVRRVQPDLLLLIKVAALQDRYELAQVESGDAIGRGSGGRNMTEEAHHHNPKLLLFHLVATIEHISTLGSSSSH